MDAKAKYALIGLAVVAVGTGGYFLYQKYNKKSTEKTVDDFENTVKSGDIPTPSSSGSSNTPSLPAPSKSTQPYKPKPSTSTFPLMRGSKGVLVKDVQNSLVKKFGGSILPKYGADGFYGEEMEVALSRKGLPTTITSEAYGKIISGKISAPSGENKGTKKPSVNTTLTPDSTAALIYSGVMEVNIDTALKGLFQIGSVNEYIKVNEKFKKKEIRGIHKTIVTALSHAFPKEPERSKYRSQLYRIGLKYRGDQWQLTGLFGTVGQKLMTIKKTKVWHRTGISMMVPSHTIIGTFLRGRNGLTEFRTADGRRLYVETIYVKYLKEDYEPGN